MTVSIRHLVAFGLLLGLACSGGCSFESANGTVSGEVFLDEKPLKEGIIRFVPADGQSQTGDAPIVDGKFIATVPVGEKRVEISAPKVVGKMRMYPDAPEVDKVEELLPARYNVQSELKLTVQSGSQEKRFDLKSKGP